MIKVVIVDDEPIVFDTLREMIQSIDPDFSIVGVAKTNHTAVNLLQEKEPDVLFVDINMPRGSGLELLDSFPTRTFQVVFITGYASLEPFTKKYRHVGFLTKPFDEDDLKMVLKKIKQNMPNQDDNILRNENLL